MNLNDQGIPDIKQGAETKRKEKVIGDAIQAIFTETGLGLKCQAMANMLEDKKLPARGVTQEETIGHLPTATIIIKVVHR